MNMDAKLSTIIDEEFKLAKRRIIERIMELLEPCPAESGGPSPLPSFPNPERYREALALYREEKNHSRVARELGVTINAAKKYYTWFVKHGYLPTEEAELSEAEKKIVNCVFERGMSLTATAKELGCSVTNVVRRRDSAISKGYVPPERKEE